MKGIIFTVLEKMVQEKFGLETWDLLLAKVNPQSGGAYTTAATYEDAELLNLVSNLSIMTSISQEDLIFAFGEYMLLQLSIKYPGFFKGIDFRNFLVSIDNVIHVEVKKLYPEANLPDFQYEMPSENELIMLYRSPRKMCRLAEGLIQGASLHFNTKYNLKHTKCLHRGDDHCRMEIKIEAAYG